MFGWFGQSRDRTAVRALYESALAASRQPPLYSSIHVPDTVEGRFEMLALHLAALLDRLARCDPPASRLAKLLTEQFVVDMDDAMRAYGVGDLTVPRKVKTAAAALYDRYRAYGAATAAPEQSRRLAWHDALAAQLQPLKGGDRLDLGRLARYAASLAPHLAVQQDQALAVGILGFPSILPD